MDNRGQISAELLIVLAAMAALALFLVDQLNATAKEAEGVYTDKTDSIFSKLEDMGS